MWCMKVRAGLGSWRGWGVGRILALKFRGSDDNICTGRFRFERLKN